MSERLANSRRLTFIAIAGVFVLFVVTGLRGIDFGHHWDEKIQRRAVKAAVKDETLLPRFYNYPSVAFWISVAAAAPEISDAVHVDPSSDLFEIDKPSLFEFLDGDEYELRARRLFLLASALAILWVALAALADGRAPGTALFAAALLGCSWEFAYHARWPAPDTVMAQFTALCLAALLAARSRPRPGTWCLLAAVAAGLAAGTKYPGGLLLFAVVPACVHHASREGRSAVRAGVAAVLLFGATYLATTPGTILQPRLFWNHVTYEATHYSKGHWGFTVDAGLDHLTHALRYLSFELFSAHPAIATLFSLLAILGAALLWRESRPVFALLVVLPLVYLSYMASHRVLFVRNLLFLAPFGALLAARGAGYVAGRLPRAAAAGWCSLLALALVANAGTLIASAEEIRGRGADALGHDLASYLGAHPDQRFHLSKHARRSLLEAGLEVPAHAEYPEAQADAIACTPDELRGHLLWPANAPPGLLATIGPRSVNYRWYTTWNEPWIAVVTPEFADWARTVIWHPQEPDTN